MTKNSCLLNNFFRFEANLKQKLQQKSNSQTSEEQVLLKAFKFFDTNNSGTLDAAEFAKAIEKIGIMIPTKNVSESKNEDITFYRTSMPSSVFMTLMVQVSSPTENSAPTSSDTPLVVLPPALKATLPHLSSRNSRPN